MIDRLRRVMRLVALPFVLLALQPFQSSVQPVPAPVRAQLTGEFWHSGCPVSLSGLRLLTVSYWDFGGRIQTGQLVVHRTAAVSLARVFRRLYELRFRIRHMSVTDAYGPRRLRPADRDITDAFECRGAVPSPCSGGKSTGNWSEHAYGLAVDLNPIENPYIGCGRSRERASRPYFDRTRVRRGMVTPAVVQAFKSIGWGWGGDWYGSTKDYMHFSASGH